MAEPAAAFEPRAVPAVEAAPRSTARHGKAGVVVFGFDVAEISQIRRIRAMQSLGYAVHSFTMRRENMNRDFSPDWPNTHLFRTDNGKLHKRAMVILGSVLKMARPANRRRVQAADVIVARNLDMLIIAWAARALAGRGRVPLVYECLDINGNLVGEGAKPRAMRWLERALLSRTALLIVSSPGFVREYFARLQGWTGPWALWENKLAAGAALPPRPVQPPARPAGGPVRIGWVGTIRCSASLAILAEAARRMQDGLEVHISGVVHRHVIPEFDEVVAAHPNLIFHGPYRYPEDLAQVYARCDMVWAQDLWERGRNSDWLLPNRIYEASWAGCPSVALASTETGRRVASDDLGWTVDDPSAEALVTLLGRLTPDEIAARAAALLARPASDFVQDGEEIRRALDPLMTEAAAR